MPTMKRLQAPGATVFVGRVLPFHCLDVGPTCCAAVPWCRGAWHPSQPRAARTAGQATTNSNQQAPAACCLLAMPWMIEAHWKVTLDVHSDEHATPTPHR